MNPRSFPMDSQNRAQDLAAEILSAAAPPAIAAAVAAVESFLLRHASDQSRAFFSIGFPALLCRLFGFDDSFSPSRPSPSSAWIDHAAGDPALAHRLFALLSPSGPLFASVAAADRHALVRYVFPPERLPEWMRFALQSDKDPSELAKICPLFKDRVKQDKIQNCHQIQLNVFEYYMFWFAYYPVCRGNSENSDSNLVGKKRRFKLENWTSSLPVLSGAGRKSGQKAECGLYLRLLYAYLRAFVPKCGLGSYQPYRSSLLHYSLTYDGTAYLQAEFLVYTFVHFWMVDNDFSPLPVSVCRSFDISFPYRAVLGETPPTAGLGEVLMLAVKYLNCISIASGEENDLKVYDGSPVGKGAGSVDVVRWRAASLVSQDSIGSWNSVMQRPLYRFILRTFLFCPMGTSIKNAGQVFSLWATYMEPWRTNAEDFVEFETPEPQNTEKSQKENLQSLGKRNERKERHGAEPGYTPVWQLYVLSNYLFYSSLVVHFLGFAHKFLHANVESVIQMVSQVLNILTSSKELLDVLRKVDCAYHSKTSGSSAYSSHDMCKFVPSIREQLQDWEDGLCESDADGSYLHENWNHDLRLFNDGEDGAHNLLQLFVLRAEHEAQLASGDVSQSLKALDAIKFQMDVLFGGPIKKSELPTSSEETHCLHHGRVEVFTPKHPGVGKRTWADVKYKGDWMHRPISDNEVAWLARLLIRLSDRLNEALGLDRVDEGDSTGPTYVEVGCDVGTVGGPKEALLMVLSLVGSWLGLLGHAVVRFMRAHRLKINLRVLASNKFLMVLLVYAVVFGLKRAFCRASNLRQ